jgi:hypothetical protein
VPRKIYKIDVTEFYCINLQIGKRRKLSTSLKVAYSITNSNCAPNIVSDKDDFVVIKGFNPITVINPKIQPFTFVPKKIQCARF